ncbi:MAG: hypothetical protein ACPL7G_06825 [Chloroflexia bacterium]
MDTLLARIRYLLADLDGVFYRGDMPLPGAADFVRWLGREGIPYLFLTNNSTRTPQQYAEKLARLGLPAHPEQILTSALATRAYLEARAPRGTGVYFIGMQGLEEALLGDGYFRWDEERPVYVVVGLDTHLTYEKLRRATLLIRAGATFIGTNPDRTFPAPEGITPGCGAILAALDPRKDVDGVHPENAGRLAQAEPVGRGAPGPAFFVPATPAGGMELLRRYGVEFAGKHAVVVGRSNIVGKPMALLLLRENATVTVCHSRTSDLPAVCRLGDILAVAVGRARMVRRDWVKPGAIVVDFGVNFVRTCPSCGADNRDTAAVCAGCGASLEAVEARMVGDVDYEGVAEVAGMITPVPGGTGPMTNVMLIHNLLTAARQVGRSK